jgi:hypothetical protein
MMLELGTWALDHHRAGPLTREQWLALVPYLVGAAPDTDAAARLVRAVWQGLEVELLEGWQRDMWSGELGGQPSDLRIVAGTWLVALFVRSMPTSGPAPNS